MFKRVITLALCAMITPSFASDGNPERVEVIPTTVPQNKAALPSLSAYDVELGFDFGTLSVEDFNTNPVVGVNLNFYVTPKFFGKLKYASSDTEKSNVEQNLNFNPDRTFSYGAIGAGYQLFSGSSAIGSYQRFTSGIFALAGIEFVEFANNDTEGFFVGATYKCLINESLTFDINFLTHVFDREFLGEEKTTMNNELSVGLNILF